VSLDPRGGETPANGLTDPNTHVAGVAVPLASKGGLTDPKTDAIGIAARATSAHPRPHAVAGSASRRRGANAESPDICTCTLSRSHDGLTALNAALMYWHVRFPSYVVRSSTKLPQLYLIQASMVRLMHLGEITPFEVYDTLYMLFLF
jgi:hypothetical protein